MTAGSLGYHILHMDQIYTRLLFPEKAENLTQYKEVYNVRLDHWKSLSSLFQSTFQTVYERRSAAILLVHGDQGCGKTLFGLRMEEDFKRTREGQVDPQPDNLWHSLIAAEPANAAIISQATNNTYLERLAPEAGWLHRMREFAQRDQHRVRIFLIDNAHRSVILREWAGLSHGEYLGLMERQQESVALQQVAEQLVADCRGDFQRSIFLLFSNKGQMMNALLQHIEETHRGLATCLELPLPAPQDKEAIVRTNTNRLNRVSYWYCLDAATKEDRAEVYKVLQEPKGFTDSFRAVDQALRGDARRKGRPANQNIITFVTLATKPDAVSDFLDRYEEIDRLEHHRGAHHAIWLMKYRWASPLYRGRDAELSRRTKLVESEFCLRWITLDDVASYALCQPPVEGDVGTRLLKVITDSPSIGDSGKKLSQRRAVSGGIDAELDTLELGNNTSAVTSFIRQFRDAGQRRAATYEPILAMRLGSYNRSLKVFSRVKPDYIVSEYHPCAVTAARSDGDEDISDAIRRGCHTIEFTAFLGPGMAGIEEYLMDKVERYALLLESV